MASVEAIGSSAGAGGGLCPKSKETAPANEGGSAGQRDGERFGGHELTSGDKGRGRPTVLWCLGSFVEVEVIVP